jgi:aldehyde dehydrogenase (NAD+)
MEDEIFGPILPVLKYSNLDEAIQTIKSLPKPLSCYVFSNSRGVKKKVMNELSFGGGGVNEAVMHVTNPNLPFGGVGPSGIGKYHGEAGFNEFTNYKGIIDKTTKFELNIKYSPLSSSKLWWIRRFFNF